MRLSVIGFTVLLFAGPVPLRANDLETAFQSLQEAQSKKDAALVKKLAAQVCALARAETAKPSPADPGEKELWTKRVAYLRDIEAHSEYALYTTAVQGTAPVMLELLSALEEQNPKSKYLDYAYDRYFLALVKNGASAKVPVVAEKALAHFPQNEDLLLVLADSALGKNQSDRALGYASRLVAVLQKHQNPEGVPPADWQRKRRAGLGRGYWIVGMVQAQKNKYQEADSALRSALPLIEENSEMTGAALFHLGVVNYQIGRMLNSRPRVLEAAKFCDKAAAIKSPYAEQAWRNANIMRQEVLKMP